MSNQLIIIGNGFDLACKLESSYKDFYKYKFNELNNLAEEREKKQNKSIAEIKTEMLWNQEFKSDNFWYQIFWLQDKSDKDWMEIEKLIEDIVRWVVGDNENKDEFIPNNDDSGILYYENKDDNNFIRKFFSSLYFNNKIPKSKFSIELEKSKGKKERTFKEIEMHSIIARYFDGSHEKIRDCFLKLVFKDLNELEKEFAEYISSLVNNNGKYLTKANLLHCAIVENSVNKNNIGEIQILSFNYSYINPINRARQEDKIINIHGNMLDEVIFGIDGFDLNERYELLPFIKTYRIVQNKNREIELNKEIKYIKFFGHSLAKADYSYFQTIFDAVNLYQSKTIVVFYYYIYNPEEKEEIIEQCKANAFKLLTEYGKTLDNKDHGKNLIHKLLIEGRMHILELK